MKQQGLTIGEYVKGVDRILIDDTSLRIFTKVKFDVRLAVPNDSYWNMWLSEEQKQILIDARLIPEKIDNRWYVNVPDLRPRGHGTKHVSDIMRDILNRIDGGGVW